jgi:hypothetical protein
MVHMKNRSSFAQAFARDFIALVCAIAVFLCCASTAQAQVTTLLGTAIRSLSGQDLMAGFDSGAFMDPEVGEARSGKAEDARLNAKVRANF